MEESLLKDLETAAHIIMAPPTVVSREQRQQSEAIFMNFRRTKSPYVLCQTILEKSVVDLVLFEAADVLKKAVVAEWMSIPDRDKASLRQYLLNYIIQRDIPVFIRDKLLQVVAIMIKRASLEDLGVERGQIIEETKKMLTSGDIKQQILSCSITLAILEEYCNIVRSDDTGLTTHEHFRAKKQFEVSDLLKVFVMTLQAMEQLIKVFDASHSMHLYLFKQMLSVMETILAWGFLLPKLQIVRFLQPSLSKKIIDTSETVTKALHAPPLRLHAQWKNVVFEPKLLEIFFYIYWKIRDNEDLQPKALICILQLSTLKGPIITDNKEESITYLTNYLTHFLSMLNTIEIKEKEAYSFSLILRKLLQLLPRAQIKDLPNSLCDAFMQQTLAMTLKFIELAAMEEAMTPDETVYIDALGNLLEIWLYVLNDKENYPAEVMVPFITQMFEKYIQYHLAAPDGMRGVGRDYESIDEIADFEESDRERFKEQLIIIGYFGREILTHSLSLLSKLLEDRTRNLGTQLHLLHSTKTMSASSSKTMVNLFEDIHWILLVTGHVLALEADGESAMIPGEILQLCTQQIANGVTDVTNSLKLLASPSQDIQEIPNAVINADPVIRLIAAGFRLCELEKSAIEVRMYQFLSPELSSTLVWFLRRWSDAYLMPVNEEYVSTIFRQAFGTGTPGSVWVINYLLNKICLNAQFLRAEQSVVEETCELFLVLLKRKDRCRAIFNSEFFRSICDLKSVDLPATAKRKLLKGFVMVASSVESEAMRAEYLGKILAPIEEKYKMLISHQNFQSVYQEEHVKLKVIEILEELIGCVQGAYQNSLTIIFTKIQCICKELPIFLDLYHNYAVIVELILELVCEIVSVIGNVTSEQVIRTAVHDCCFSVIRIYVKNNSNRVSLGAANTDSDPVDLILILKLLNYLTSKPLFTDDLLLTGSDESNAQSSEICIFGLTHIVPLITIDLIKYPDLCLQYYSTITSFIEEKYSIIPNLHPDLLKQLLGSIELGLSSFTSEIESKCLEFLEMYANNVYFNQDPQAPMAQLLRPFLKLSLDMILGQKIDLNNTMDWYRMLFVVICCFPDHFKELLNNFLSELLDPEHVITSDVVLSITSLLNDMEYVNNRMTKSKFVERFDRFVANFSSMYKK
ncbi:exportin-4-like [Topomyia yanbarensis]|uniref:exportin-4-like n=1 Tax=Topomyia yanbarensis TaxID=2498891 RepID=UPI00273BDAF2|nr:exportin-4-like [Topomyia yanbarensis]XP_058826828.1 exportin-4-like [Topomyia yanbarensis]